MTLNPSDLRSAMRSWVTGVTVVTARHGEAVHGMTVSSFTSVSLEPPLVLVCIQQAARSHALIEQSQAFAVSILGEDQAEISNRFSNPQTETSYRFADLEILTLETGAPILASSQAWLDCKVVHSHAMGTHTVFIGEVVAAGSRDIRKPLVYLNRTYRRLAEEG